MSGAEDLLYFAGGLGPGMQQMGVSKMKRERRDILNQAFDEQRNATDKANSEILGEAKSLSGEARKAAMDAQESAAYDQTQQDLAGAGGDIVGSDTGGNVSSDFIKAKADKAITEGNRLTAIAREAAKLRAPGQLTTEEAQRQADLMARNGSMWGTVKNKTRAATLDAEGVQMPWYGQVGQIITQAGNQALRAGAGG